MVATAHGYRVHRNALIEQQRLVRTPEIVQPEVLEAEFLCAA